MYQEFMLASSAGLTQSDRRVDGEVGGEVLEATGGDQTGDHASDDDEAATDPEEDSGQPPPPLGVRNIDPNDIQDEDWDLRPPVILPLAVGSKATTGYRRSHLAASDDENDFSTDYLDDNDEPAAAAAGAAVATVADFEAAAMRAADRVAAADAIADEKRYVFVAQTSATSRTEPDQLAKQNHQHHNHHQQQQQQQHDLSDSEMDDFTAPSSHFNDISGQHHPDGVLPAKRGRLVTFYRNGDPHYKGLSASISQRAFVSMESLLVWLNEKIPTTAGVQHVFRLPDGQLMRDVGEFQPGCQYVVSSVQKLIRNVDYGGKGANPWRSKKTSAKAGNITRADIRLIRDAKGFTDENEAQSLGTASSKKGTPAPAGRLAKTRVITVISNSHRSSREKVLVNPSTMQNFEDMLLDFTNLLVMSKPPVQTLYTSRPPYKRVCSFSQLFREFKDHDTFIACGREFAPSELGNKREAPPSSNSSEDALRGGGGGGTTNGMEFVETPPELDHRKPRKQFRRAEDRYQDLDTNRTSGTAARPPPVPISVPIRGRRMTFYAPTVRETQHRQPPEQTLRLDWVYGFTGGDSAASGGAADSLLHALPTGELVYAVANTAVVFDPEGHRQRHYTEHTGPIVCMDVHPTKSVIVTGQRSVPELRVDAQLRVWDAESLGTFVVLGDADLFQSCVTSLSFSVESQGAYLLALDGLANGHRQTMFVFDWQTRRLVAKTKTSREPVRRAAFHPDDDSSLVSFGKRHVHFWRIFQEEDGRSRILRDKKSGVFESSPPEDVLSLSFDLVGNAVTGDSSGCLQLWVRDEEDAFVLRSLDHLQRSHRGPITCLRILGDGTLLSTSGSCIRAWDTLNDYSLVKERILNESTENLVAVAVKSPRSSDGLLVVATSSNSLLEGSMQDRFNCIVQGHSCRVQGGELDINAAVSVATHPREHSIVTCAGDRGVCKWSTLHRRLLWRASVEVPCTCACYHPRGHLIGIGTSAGRFIVLHSETGAHALSSQVVPSDHSAKQLRSAAFSPDGNLLAIGAEDGSAYIYSVEENGLMYRRYREGTLKGHSAPIVCLDWAADSSVLRTQSADLVTKLWSMSSLTQVSQEDASDVRFATETCYLSYGHAAAWQPYVGTDRGLLCAARSSTADKLCVGDDNGHLTLYRFPAHPEQAQGISTPAHVRSLHSLAFTFDDSAVISSGRGGPLIMQWSLIDSGFK